MANVRVDQSKRGFADVRCPVQRFVMCSAEAADDVRRLLVDSAYRVLA